MMKNNNSYKLPLALVFSLFFLWAISSNLLPTMIRQLMKTCELNTFEASFTETAYWLAYFIFPIPIAMFMKRYSYKAGIIFGLVLAAAGGLLFFPAAMLKEYWAYLCIFFIIATGMCFLETAANPYVTALGDTATAPQRLNLAQSFNGLGAFIAAMFLSKLILSGLILSGTHYTRETLPSDYPGGWEAYIQFETDAMKTPYLALAVLLLVIAGVFIFSRLPKIGDEGQRGTSKEKLIDFSVWKRSHLVYCCSYAGIPESEATTYFGLYMLAFLLGRWIGTGLMVRFRPQDMLLVYALVNILLCAVVAVCGGWIGLYAMLGISFFMSIMYPTQFSLALKDLGSQTKSGSAFLVMSIVGNACLPQFTAYLMHVNEQMYHLAYVVPMVCFLFCAYYGWRGYKVLD